MQILCLGDDWQSARVPHAPGTSYPWPGQGPIKVDPLHRLTLLDPGAQCRFSNGHLYVEGTAHGHLFMMLTSGPSGQVCKTIVLPLLRIHGRERSFLSQPHHNSTLQCQLWMWKVLEAGLHVILCPAQPQEGVPQVCCQETSCRFWQQAQQWWRRRWQPQWLHQGYTQEEGLQGSSH